VLGDPPARALERLRGLVRERVDRAVDVGVVVRQRGLDRVEHRPRLLRGVGAVEVGEPLAAELAREDRELGGDRLDVERWGECGAHLLHG
jgi:hypothetical protein